MITKDKFGVYNRYTLKNDMLEASFIDLGATLVSLKYKGQERAVCYQTAEAALEGSGFLCKTVGRYANRIGNSAFDLAGKHYVLPANEGKNQLHGGPDSYDKRIWDASCDGDELTFTIASPDGDNGYPGNLVMKITFTLEDSAVKAVFRATTDATTVFAPTVHPYFNLGGTGNVHEAKLQIAATGHLEVDEGLIPTGKVLPCEGRFDFSTLREIGGDFDDCFVTPDDFCCALEMGGCRMEMYTDMPAIQIYTGQGLGAPYTPNYGIAIEPEFFPDSPNHPDFPSTVLQPGEEYEGYVMYKFI